MNELSTTNEPLTLNDVQDVFPNNIRGISNMLYIHADLVARLTHSTTDKVLSVSMNLLNYISNSANDRLETCRPKSYLMIVRDLILCNLDLNIHQHAYVTPTQVVTKGADGRKIYTNEYNAKLEISYKGYMHIINSAFPDCVLKPIIIFENDTLVWRMKNSMIDYEYERHSSNIMRDDYRNMKGIFTFLEYTKHGKIMHEVEELPISVINTIKSKTKSKDKNGNISGPWDEFFDQQAIKSAIRRILKRVLPFVTSTNDREALSSVFDIENDHYDLEPAQADGISSRKADVRSRALQHPALQALHQEVTGENPKEITHTVTPTLEVTVEAMPEEDIPVEVAAELPKTKNGIVFDGALIGVTDYDDSQNPTLEEATAMLASRLKMSPDDDDRAEIYEANEELVAALVKNKRMDLITMLADAKK